MYEECAKERDEAVAELEKAIEREEKLAKGMKICPQCIGVKKVNSQDCTKCKGEGYVEGK